MKIDAKMATLQEKKPKCTQKTFFSQKSPIFLQFASCFAFFLKRAQDFDLLKQVPESSHQTVFFGRNQYIGTLILS